MDVATAFLIYRLLVVTLDDMHDLQTSEKRTNSMQHMRVKIAYFSFRLTNLDFISVIL
jgi:hypothetical protein